MTIHQKKQTGGRPCLSQVGCQRKREMCKELFVSSMHGKEYQFFRCLHCGLTYHMPEPIAQELRNHYTKYGVYSDRDRMQKQLEQMKAHYEWLARILWRFVDKEKPRMLDVGCANGILLKHFMDFGYDVSGLEVDPSSAELAGELVGSDKVFTGDLKESPFMREQFDLLLLEQVIEHVPNPFEMLLQSNKCLAERGILYISTPNFGGPSFKLLRDKWKNTLPGDHISMFSRSSMEKFLKLAGFQVLDYQVEGFAFNRRRNGVDEYNKYKNPLALKLIHGIGEVLKKLRCGDGLLYICRKVHEADYADGNRETE